MIDPITLEVLWNRLISIVNEQAAALIHASFTTVVREAGDLSAGVFDAEGNMLAQAVTGTPGHINTMANCVRNHVVKKHPIQSLEEGDTLITNDPWEASGHLFDLTIVTPVFYRGKGIGWFASTCHATDIGGLTMGASAKELYEEGLQIPLMKLFSAGRPNETLFAIIRKNVRVPGPVIGDIHAQHAGNLVGARKLIEMMEEYRLKNLSVLASLLLDRTEQALAKAISDLPDGQWRSEVQIDGFDDPVTICCQLSIKDGFIEVDYTGTSSQVNRGINVVLNYTQAYTTYPLMAAIAPNIPNNHGAFRRIRVTAPEGCIVNCRPPAPVGARHLIGHFVSQPVLECLSKIIPDQVIADGAAGLWNTMLEGTLNDDGDLFAYIYFSAGGMGARSNQDGLSATAFPSGITGVPAEIIESVAPIIMHKRTLVIDSGGAGKFRGGLGQAMELETTTGRPVLHSCMYDRTKFPARGYHGGKNGALGHVSLSTGAVLHPKDRYYLLPGQRIQLQLPGGGGFYPPKERAADRVLDDVIQGYVSIDAAEKEYGVVIQPETLEIDWERTNQNRNS